MWKECICGKDCNSYLESFFNSISEGVAFHKIVYNENGHPIDYKFLATNNAFTDITGLTREDIIGKKVSDLAPDLNPFWINTYEKILTLGISISFEIYNEELDKHFRVYTFGSTNDNFTALFADITDLKKTNELMKKHQLLFDNAQDIIFYADTNGNIVDANMSAILKYGYSLSELTKLNVLDLRHNSTNNLFQQQMKEADKNGLTFEGTHIKKDGSSFPVEVSVKSVLVDDKRLRIHIVRDISERKMAEEKILYLANYDSLTGIPNRSYLMKHLNLILESARRGNFKFALMLFDIDKFKRINDVYGHAVGDVVLKEIAQVVQNTISEVDFVARLGGDEFVIIQPYIEDYEDSSILAQKIIEKLKTPLKVDEAELTIALSIGISIYPNDSCDIETLITYSDKAMYVAKQTPGSTFEFYSNVKDFRYFYY
jgi:diguanylate cyclase (GGDEF)-like protein/PAS domain S-box-containing protein